MSGNQGQIHLKRFDINRIKSTHVVLFVGRRGSGKTTLVRDVLFHKRKMPSGVLFGGKYDLGDLFPPTFAHDTYKPEILKTTFERCKKTLSPTAGVLDDCMFDKQMFRRCKVFRDVLMNGRHFNFLILITVQYLMDMAPELRSQVDFVFVLKENIIANIERLWKYFFGVVESVQTFKSILMACTDNYGALVLDNTSLSNNLSDSLFYYRAEPHPRFKFGNRRFWYFHEVRGKRQEENENERKLITL